MPIYNGIEFINESVSSILNQTYQNWELIIGVNGHQQNSIVFKIAKQYENNKIKVYDLYTIKNKSTALNKMIEYCNYDYVALLDVDDIWLPEKLLIQYKLLNKYDVIGTQCVYFDEKGGNPNIPFGDISNFNFYSMNPIINSSVLIKKNLCYWNNLFIEDYDLWIRLWKQKNTFFNFSDILVKHRIHSNSAFNSKGNLNHDISLINFHKNN